MNILPLNKSGQPLTAKVGVSHARTPEEAVREASMGFATHVSDTPHEDALKLAKIIANKHPAAMRGAKTLCNAMAELSDADLLMLESTEQLKVIRTPNQMEAVMAEMQKRKPVFAE